MIAVVGNLLLGLAFLFHGLDQFSSGLKQLSSRKFRSLVTRFITPRWKAVLFGFVSGIVMQSSSAALMVLASLNASGLLAPRQAFPMIVGYKNGNCLLVFLAVLDFKLAVVYLLGLSVLTLHFSKDDRWRNVLQTMAGLGLIFFSIAIMKDAAKPLHQSEWFMGLMTVAGDATPLSALIGLALGFIAQSSSVVAMVSVGLVDVGLVTMPQTLLLMYGAVIGSSLFRTALGFQIRGSSRQLVRFQNLFNFAGAGAFILLFYVEHLSEVPLVAALVQQLSQQRNLQAATAFLLMNVAAGAVTILLHPWLARRLERTFPATTDEELSRPQFLPEGMPEESEGVLELVQREQARELEHLVALLGTLHAARPRPDLRTRLEAFHTLGREVETVVRAVLRLPLAPQTAIHVADLHNRQALLMQLADAVNEAAVSIRKARIHRPLHTLAEQCLESLEFLLLTAEEAALATSDADRDLARELCNDRGPTMERLRAAYVQSGRVGDAEVWATLIELTASVEKVVWLLRRLLAIRPYSPDEEEEREAPQPAGAAEARTPARAW